MGVSIYFTDGRDRIDYIVREFQKKLDMMVTFDLDNQYMNLEVFKKMTTGEERELAMWKNRLPLLGLALLRLMTTARRF